MFSKRLADEVELMLLFLGLGLLLGNIVMIYMALVPLFFIVLSLAQRRPSKPKVTRGEERFNAFVGDTIKVSSSVEVEEGLGIVTVADTVPDHFEPLAGSNFRAFWKGPGKLTRSFGYEVRCTRRGIYSVGRMKWELVHPSCLEQTEASDDEGEAELIVHHRPLNLGRIRDLRPLTRISIPIGKVSRIGTTTTNFMEIREYINGDPYRFINWKATARLAGTVRKKPLVNEFEREGKKTVVLCLDTGRSMSIGGSVENALEHAIQAALALSRFYISLGCSVGLINYREGRMIIPDSGRRQSSLIARELLGVEVTDGDGTIKRSIVKFRGHLAGLNPLLVLITMLDEANLGEVLEGINAAKSQLGLVDPPRMVIIHVKGYELAAKDQHEELAASLLDMKALPLLGAARGTGALVVPWNPRTRSLEGLVKLDLKGEQT